MYSYRHVYDAGSFVRLTQVRRETRRNGGREAYLAVPAREFESRTLFRFNVAKYINEMMSTIRVRVPSVRLLTGYSCPVFTESRKRRVLFARIVKHGNSIPHLRIPLDKSPCFTRLG